jgi:DNA invertase Pin-like site-specific DNA recombinase
MIAIYLRVSTKRQDTRSQESELKAWAASQSEPVCWYRDKMTGKTMDRPDWNRLEGDMMAGKISTIVVWRLDRLGRTAKGLTALFAELTARKVNLVSLKDGLDLTTPAGRLMAHVLASVAEYETELRGERVRAGQEAARAAGKVWGGGKPGRRVKVTLAKESMIHTLKSEGYKITTIARNVGLSRQTVYTILGKDRPT